MHRPGPPFRSRGAGRSARDASPERSARSLAGVVGLVALVAGVVSGCLPDPLRIETPVDGSRTTLDPTDPADGVAVEIDLGQPLGSGGRLAVTIRTGGATPVEVGGAFAIDGSVARARLSVASFAAGVHTLTASVDRDGDGTAEAEVSAELTVEHASGHSIARVWNEMLLDAIRRDTPRPTVHARNLFHLSIAMWDCWVAYDTRTAGQAYLYVQKHAAA